jgi:hypothetical protein
MRGRFDIDEQGIVVDADVPWSEGQQRLHPRVIITIANVRSAIRDWYCSLRSSSFWHRVTVSRA